MKGIVIKFHQCQQAKNNTIGCMYFNLIYEKQIKIKRKKKKK